MLFDVCKKIKYRLHSVLTNVVFNTRLLLISFFLVRFKQMKKVKSKHGYKETHTII